MAFAVSGRRMGAALISVAMAAVLIWFGTGLFPLWPLLWFAPVPVLVFAARSSWRAAGVTAFVAWAAGNLNLWGYYTRTLHVPALAAIEIDVVPALVFALAVLLFRALLRRGAAWTALLAFPAAWVSFEYVVNLNSPHGTAVSLSYSQLNFLPVLQLASITGPWGIGFLLFSFSAALAIGIHLWKTDAKQALRVVGATLGVLAAVLVFGAVRLALPPPPGNLVKVGMAASDLPANRDVAAPGAEADRLLRAYAEQAEALAARGAQVIVLPEHLAELLDAQMGSVDALFQSIADRTQTTIVVGVGHVEPDARHNQARVYAPRAAALSYNKHHLLPPFESKYAPGTSVLTRPEATGRWGVAICKDMDFTRLSREYGQAGAGLMLVPAWDFTVDRVSHGHMAVMRAVESGFGLARAARGGFLTITDNRGRILAETESNSAAFATLIADVPAVHDNTLYLLLGDWFAWVSLAMLALVLARLFMRAGA